MTSGPRCLSFIRKSKAVSSSQLQEDKMKTDPHATPRRSSKTSEITTAGGQEVEEYSVIRREAYG